MNTKDFKTYEETLLHKLCDKHSVSRDQFDDKVFRKFFGAIKANGGKLGFKFIAEDNGELDTFYLASTIRELYDSMEVYKLLKKLEDTFGVRLYVPELSQTRISHGETIELKKAVDSILTIEFIEEYCREIGRTFNENKEYIEWSKKDAKDTLDYILKTSVREIEKYGLAKHRSDAVIGAVKELNTIFNIAEISDKEVTVKFVDDIKKG